MIIEDDKKNNIINMTVQFFMEYVVKFNLKHYFKINISNNIAEDYMLFDKKYKPESNDYAGLTILPDNEESVIQILVSENTCMPDIILHELSYMYDFILFASYFCRNKLYKVKNHKYYQTFVYWSEFHVKQIDIPYSMLFLDMCNNIPKENLLLDFKSKIKDFYYPRFNEKFVNKKNIQIRDVMWYIGEILVCNLYDENNTYTIPQEIIELCDFDIILLYHIFENYPDFESFASEIKIFYKYFR